MLMKDSKDPSTAGVTLVNQPLTVSKQATAIFLSVVSRPVLACNRPMIKPSMINAPRAINILEGDAIPRTSQKLSMSVFARFLIAS